MPTRLLSPTLPLRLEQGQAPELIVIVMHGYGASNSEFTALGAQLTSAGLPLAAHKVGT